MLTGGASQIAGLVTLAEKIFKVPARMGTPQCVRGLSDVRHNPSFATGVGLLLHGFQRQAVGMPSRRFDSTARGVWTRMREWVQGNF